MNRSQFQSAKSQGENLTNSKPHSKAVPLNLRAPGDKMKISRMQLSNFMKSKEDTYKVLAVDGQVFLPPEPHCTMKFLSQIMSGKKRFFFNHHAKMITVPRFAELSAKSILQLIDGNEFFMEYLPDYDVRKRPLPRDYVLTVSESSIEHWPPYSFIDCEHPRSWVLQGQHQSRRGAEEVPP